MAFPVFTRVLARLAGYRSGRPTMIDAPCLYDGSLRLPAGAREVARVAGFKDGRPLLVTGCCKKDCAGNLLPGSYHLARVAGVQTVTVDGKPVLRPLLAVACNGPCGRGQLCQFLGSGKFRYLLPCTLYATLTSAPSCVCQGNFGVYTFPINYDAGNHWWAYNSYGCLGTALATLSMELRFSCYDSSQAQLYFKCSATGSVAATYLTTPSAPPLSASFGGVDLTGCSVGPCAGTVLVTELPP
jgi:hypothetical protein